MKKCKICEKNEVKVDDLCELCDDTLFCMDEITTNYLLGSIVDPAVVGALANFSWIYAGYPRLWGFYNNIINTIYKFIMYPSKKFVSVRELSIDEYTSIDIDIILDVLVESKILEPLPTDKTSTMFQPGELARISIKRIRDELITDKTNKTNRKRFKSAAQEMFGITAVMLTKILLEKKLKDPVNQWMPRKSISVFLTLSKIIRLNFTEGVKIKKQFPKDLMDEMQALIKVSKDGRIRILLEMLGLSYITPGKTNIISNISKAEKDLLLNNEMLNLLEYLRERIRERDRERERVR